jgi:hypothetical protein
LLSLSENNKLNDNLKKTINNTNNKKNQIKTITNNYSNTDIVPTRKL